MPVAAFDTLKYAKQLRQAGVPEEQAEAMSTALAEALLSSIQDLAKKSDVDLLRQEMKQMEQRVDARFEKIDSKVDRLEAILRGELILLKWMFGATFAGVVAIVVRLFFFRLV